MFYPGGSDNYDHHHHVFDKKGFEAQSLLAAHSLYQKAYNRGRFATVWGYIRRQDRALFVLNHNAGFILGHRPMGVVNISLKKIMGTESRSHDFDIDFYPLRAHIRERWINIAAVYLMGLSVPAIDVIQVGEIYYVRDGHHRVSVARAMRMREIDANVIVWSLSDSGPIQ